MRAALLATAFAFLVLGASPASTWAADKAPPAKAEKKAGAKEVTLTGNMVCAKCVLHEAKECQNVLQVTEGGAETKYYLAPNKVAKEHHEEVCGKTAKATVTGKVSEKGGKKLLTASDIKIE
jgi:hypothetical protein